MTFSPLRPRIHGLIQVCAALAAAGLAGCSPQARKVHELARADRDFEVERYDNAESEYRAVLDLVPLEPTAIRQLGILYLNDGRLIKAVTYLRKSVELEPASPLVRLKLGAALDALGEFKEAGDDARWVLGREPQNAEALSLLARTVRTRAEVASVQAYLSDLRQHHPDCAGYHLAAGILLLTQPDVGGAEREFRQALALDPQSGAAQFELGNVLWLNHDLAGAGQAFAQAVALTPLRSATHLRYLDFQFSNHQGEAAKKALAEMNRDAPDYIPGLVYAMNVALDERRFDDCAATIQKVLEREPANYDALLVRGKMRLAQGDVAGAIGEFKRAEAIYSKVPMLKFQLALAYLQQNDSASAENSLSQAILLAPDFDLAVLLMAELNLRKGNAADAIASLTLLLSRQPHVARGYLLLGQAFEQSNNFDQALNVYRRMGALFPQDPQPPYLIGLIAARQNRNGEARAAFERSLAIAANYVPALEMLVNADLRDLRYAAALKRADDLAAKYPQSPVPWLLRAKIRSAQHDPDEAAADLKHAIVLEPKAENPYLLLSRIYAGQKKYPEALAELQALAARVPSAAAYMELGALHTELSDYPAARADYEKALTVDAKFIPALNDLAYLECEHLGQLGEALDTANRAHALAPDDPSVSDTLGWILFRKGDFAGALAQIQPAATKAPGDPAIQYHLGMVAAMLADERTARAAFQRAITSPVAFADRSEAQRQLALLDLDPAKAGGGDRQALEAAVKRDPHNPVALVRLAALEERRGAPEAAAAHFETALQINPRDAQTALELAQLYAGPLHNAKRARELAKNAHELAPDDPQISRTLGALLYQAGDYPWSLNLLVEAARFLPRQPDLLFDLARSYYSMGQVADAESTLQELLQSPAPFVRRAEAGRLAAMIAAGDSPAQANAALPEAQRALANDPAFVPALAVTALAARARGDFAAAARDYEHILAIDESFAPANLQLAMLYAEHLGNNERAFAFAAKARESYPDDPELPKIFGILDYRQANYAEAQHWLQESLQTRADDPLTEAYLGLCDFQLKNRDASVAELQRALALKLSGPEQALVLQALHQLGVSAAAPADQTVRR